ncbi:MAG: exosome complex RNA-binding protein Rrp4 [archaeon]
MRKVVIPGEIIAEGDKYLPGDWTERRGKDIVALKFGLVEESDKLLKVIPLSGVYQPRRNNVVIGKIENIVFNGWIVDIGTPETAFISLSEVPRFVNKNGMDEVMDMGDLVVAKIFDVNKRGIDLTVKGRGLGKIEEGILVEINSNKVPRIIGKEGSMVNLIKDETKCNITVGQNGFIWISGRNTEDELFAKRAVMFVAEHSFIEGLTEELKKWFEKEKGK